MEVNKEYFEENLKLYNEAMELLDNQELKQEKKEKDGIRISKEI